MIRSHSLMLSAATTTTIDNVNVGGSLRGLKEKEKENQGLKTQLQNLQTQLNQIIAGGVVGPQGKI